MKIAFLQRNLRPIDRRLLSLRAGGGRRSSGDRHVRGRFRLVELELAGGSGPTEVAIPLPFPERIAPPGLSLPDVGLEHHDFPLCRRQSRFRVAAIDRQEVLALLDPSPLARMDVRDRPGRVHADRRSPAGTDRPRFGARHGLLDESLPDARDANVHGLGTQEDQRNPEDQGGEDRAPQKPAPDDPPRPSRSL
jgi:hypothetical protein